MAAMAGAAAEAQLERLHSMPRYTEHAQVRLPVDVPRPGYKRCSLTLLFGIGAHTGQ